MEARQLKFNSFSVLVIVVVVSVVSELQLLLQFSFTLMLLFCCSYGFVAVPESNKNSCNSTQKMLPIFF